MRLPLLARLLGFRQRSGGLPQYLLVGNAADVRTPTRAGLVLEGGGTDIDEAFEWMIERSGGGDFVVLRTSGTDAYNDYIFDMTAPGGRRADSVATLIVTTPSAAYDPFVIQAIRKPPRRRSGSPVGTRRSTSAYGVGRRSPRRSTNLSHAGCPWGGPVRDWRSWANTSTRPKPTVRLSLTCRRPGRFATHAIPE